MCGVIVRLCRGVCSPTPYLAATTRAAKKGRFSHFLGARQAKLSLPNKTCLPDAFKGEHGLRSCSTRIVLDFPGSRRAFGWQLSGQPQAHSARELTSCAVSLVMAGGDVLDEKGIPNAAESRRIWKASLFHYPGVRSASRVVNSTRFRRACVCRLTVFQ